jgi:hypothetical protein
MSPTILRASGRSTRSSTSSSSSMIATRVSRGVALMRISRFISLRQRTSPRRLGKGSVAAHGVIVDARHPALCADGAGGLDGRSLRLTKPGDRPRRLRLKRTTAHRLANSDQQMASLLQHRAERHAIDTRHEVTHRKEGEHAKSGQQYAGRPVAKHAHDAPRVARRNVSEWKSGSSHCRNE